MDRPSIKLQASPEQSRDSDLPPTNSNLEYNTLLQEIYTRPKRKLDSELVASLMKKPRLVYIREGENVSPQFTTHSPQTPCPSGFQEPHSPPDSNNHIEHNAPSDPNTSSDSNDPLESTWDDVFDWLRTLRSGSPPRQRDPKEVDRDSLSSLDSISMARTQSQAQTDVTTTNTGTTRDKAKKSPCYRSDYMEMYLDLALIHLVISTTETPAYVETLINQITSADNPTQFPSIETMKADHEAFVKDSAKGYSLNEAGTTVNLFKDLKIDDTGDDKDELIHLGIKKQWRHDCVPSIPGVTTQKLGTPYPDLTFGYHRSAFPKMSTSPLWEHYTRYIATNDAIFFPYFTMEAKKPSWLPHVAVNQCVNDIGVAMKLAERVLGEEHQHILFSAALDTITARFYIMWKKDGHCYSKPFKTLVLDDFETFVMCRKMMHRIHKWARGEARERLNKALDAEKAILEAKARAEAESAA